MAYIGKSPSGTGVRIRYYFTQTSGGATSISGTDDNNKTLSFSDGEYVDVYLNGVSLVAGTDYNTTTANTIGGLSALANGDVIEVVVYDIFTVADTVSQSSGGTFNGAVTFSSNLTADGGTIKLDGNYPTGTGNVAMGDGALDDGSLSGNFNTAIGDNALSANTSGASNTAIGNDAGISNTTGFQNVFVGDTAGDANTTGAAVVAVGYGALGSNTTASNNTAVGYQALTANETGAQNTAVGTNAGNAITTASNCTVIGHNAGGAIVAGTNSTFVGYQCGDAITNQVNNVAMGVNALGQATSDANTCIGTGAGENITSGGKNTIIGRYNGNQDGLDIRTASNNIVLSDGDGNVQMYLKGSNEHWYAQPIYDKTTSNGANVNVHSDGALRRSTSSLRYKNTINDATHGLTELLALRPVTYKSNSDGDTIFGGLIAEEVHDAGLTEFVQYNTNDEPDALAYGNMVSLCIKAIQELKTELDAAKARIAALEAE